MGWSWGEEVDEEAEEVDDEAEEVDDVVEEGFPKRSKPRDILSSLITVFSRTNQYC